MKTWKQLEAMAKRQGRGIHHTASRLVVSRGDVFGTPLLTIEIDHAPIDDLDVDDMGKVLRQAGEAALREMGRKR